MWAINGHNLPIANSYEKAVQVYKKAHVHKRFGDIRRGLVNNRDDTKTVTMLDGVVKFRFHRTDLVEWWPDKLVLRCYDSCSSVVFADRFLPPSISAQTHRGGMYICQDSGWYCPKDKTLVFHLVDGKYVLDEGTAATQEIYSLDKSLAAKIRSKLKPFRQHRDALLRLRNGQHRAELRSEAGMCDVLNHLLQGEQASESMYNLLSQYTAAYDDKILLPNAYLVGGAVKQEAVIGVLLARDCPYSGRAGRLYL